MMSYDNYHYTTKVTTDPNPEYELVGDERNIFLGGGCMVVFPDGHKWAGPWGVGKVNNKSCVIVSRLDKDGKPMSGLTQGVHKLMPKDADLKAEGVLFLPKAFGGEHNQGFPAGERANRFCFRGPVTNAELEGDVPKCLDQAGLFEYDDAEGTWNQRSAGYALIEAVHDSNFGQEFVSWGPPRVVVVDSANEFQKGEMAKSLVSVLSPFVVQRAGNGWLDAFLKVVDPNHNMTGESLVKVLGGAMHEKDLEGGGAVSPESCIAALRKLFLDDLIPASEDDGWESVHVAWDTKAKEWSELMPVWTDGQTDPERISVARNLAERIVDDAAKAGAGLRKLFVSGGQPDVAQRAATMLMQGANGAAVAQMLL